MKDILHRLQKTAASPQSSSLHQQIQVKTLQGNEKATVLPHETVVVSLSFFFCRNQSQVLAKLCRETYCSLWADLLEKWATAPVRPSSRLFRLKRSEIVTSRVHFAQVCLL